MEPREYPIGVATPDFDECHKVKPISEPNLDMEMAIYRDITKPKPKIMVIGHVDHGTCVLQNPGMFNQLEKLKETHDIVFSEDGEVIHDKAGNPIFIHPGRGLGLGPGRIDEQFPDKSLVDPYFLNNIEYENSFETKVTRRMISEPDAVPVRNSKVNPKIGRNDPCPCGSGKKNKNCCKYE